MFSTSTTQLSLAEVQRRRQEAQGNFTLCCSIGSLAGMAGKVVEMPFDTVKVRLQTQQMHCTPSHHAVAGGLPGTLAPRDLYRNSLDCFHKIITREGFPALYRGLPSPMMGAAIETAVVFGIYGWFKHQILQRERTREGGNPLARSLTSIQSCMAGAATGIFTGLVLTPPELIKCRMQAQRLEPLPAVACPQQHLHLPAGTTTGVAATATTLTAAEIPYKGTLDCLARTLRTDGPQGLFKGGVSCILREVPGTALWFSAYELASRKIAHVLATGLPPFFSTTPSTRTMDYSRRCNSTNNNNNTTPSTIDFETSPITQCASGAFAGCCYWLVPYPIDTVKTRIQAYPEGVHVTHMEVIREILREEGIRGFYRGIGLTMLRAVPASAAVFLAYEQIFGMFIAR